MSTSSATPFDGHCTCGAIRYRMTLAPMIVHCCHCRWCQRESGAAFALNAMIEPDRLPPDIHIFTASKQPWVVLPLGTPAVAEYYDRKIIWPAASLERRRVLLAGLGRD